jgi:hypothetical protein
MPKYSPPKAWYALRNKTRQGGLTARGGGGDPYAGYAPSSVLFVSSVTANGIPVGNDATATGSIANPYLTIDAAYTAAAAGKVILLNGLASAPADYRHATFLNISKAITVDAVTPYGASVSSTTTSSRAVNFSPAPGVVVNIGKIIIDGRGLCPSAVTNSGGAYTVNFNATKFLNWTIYASNDNLTATFTINYTNVIGISNNCRGFIYHNDLRTGASITVDGADIRITNQNVATAATMVNLTAALSQTVTASLKRVRGTVTLLPSLTGGGNHPGVHVYNIPNVLVEDCDISVTGNYGTRASYGIHISPSPDAAATSVAGYIVRRNRIFNGTTAGIGIVIGQDVQSAAVTGKVGAGTVSGNTITGSASAAVGGLHGILIGGGGAAAVSANWIENVGLGLVDKEGNGCVWYSNVIKDAGQSYIRLKGALNSTIAHNTCVASLGFTGTFVLATNNVDNGTVNCTATVIGNNLYGDATNGPWVSVDASQAVTLSLNNHYGTGSLSATPWIYQGTTYSTFVAYKAAVETNALSVDPNFVGLAAKNYNITVGSPLRGLVPANANYPTDYAGRSFAAPAAVGAYEYAA